MSKGFIKSSLGLKKIEIDSNSTIKHTVTYNKDDYSNTLANLGFMADNLLNYSSYIRSNITQDYLLLTDLFLDNWVVQNIIEIIPDDIIKSWFDIKININEDLLKKIHRIINDQKLKDNISQGLKWGRLYGGALGVILIKGHEGIMDTELDYKTILPNSFSGIYVIDRWSGVTPSTELVDDISSPYYGLPKYYTINASDGANLYNIHYSRIVRFIGRDLPYRELQNNVYWGESEVDSIYREITKRDYVSENMAQLVGKANLSVHKIKNLNQMYSITSPEVQKRFWDTIRTQTLVESNFAVKLVDKEDDIQYMNYTFGGLADIYEMIMLDLSGACKIPATKLFGRAPAGMNATGESDLENYYNYVETIRNKQFLPIIEKLIPIIFMSTIGFIPDDYELIFESLKLMTELDKSTISSSNTNTIITVWQNNLIDKKTALRELKNNSKITGLFVSIDDEEIENGEGIYYKDIQGDMNDPLAGLMPTPQEGDIDLPIEN